MKFKVVVATTIALSAASCMFIKAQSANTPEAEIELLSNIAKDGMLEVDLGKIAEKQAKSPAVQKFAKHMVTDHSNANDMLKAAAEKDKVALPIDISKKQKEKKDALAALSGAEFDKKYMETMVAGHKQAVAAVTKEKDTGSGACQTWAKETLPTIEEHMKEANQIEAQLK
ncbi:MAG TPA: DUF4142 domain-containing protein [Planktothrix sp.]|jgi:putative membrane protein